MKTLKIFYLKNYRGIHHIGMMIILSIMMALFGITELFDIISGKFLILQLSALVASYFINEWALEKSGINDEVKKELEKLKHKKTRT